MKRNNRMKRLWILVTVICMMLTCMPLKALAEETETETAEFVIPEDVQAAFYNGVSHRISARGNGQAALRRIVRWVRPPKMG